jgi:Ser/Thr protein kinase RdoA (MazF antagonist)
MTQLNKILQAYQLNSDACLITAFGNGLINKTWKISVKDNHKNFILQRVNTSIFKKPWDIALNIKNIAAHMAAHRPGYLFLSPQTTNLNEQMFLDEDGGYYRLFPFLDGSRSFDTVSNPLQAYEAARQFALFTKNLADFDAGSLWITLPDFHNLSLRFRQFNEALTNGNAQRLSEAAGIISYLQEKKSIIDAFEAIKKNPAFKIRVMHHDTKISNVLFNKENKGLCVIDLDTVMPGYFISDVGDMLRTYLSPANEEEKDFSKIEIREDYFKAILEGYLSEMNSELNEDEKAHFLYAGKFMIYMQALRFITDHLNDDKYYGARYEGQNLVRANNQTVLLQKLIEKEDLLDKIVRDYQPVSVNVL